MISIANVPRGPEDSHHVTLVDGHTIVTAGKMVSFDGASASKAEKPADVKESNSEGKKKSRFGSFFRKKSSSNGSRSSQ